MIDLHLIGYTADLGHLVLATDASEGATRYRLVVDRDLLATLEELRVRRAENGLEAGSAGWAAALTSRGEDARHATDAPDAPAGRRNELLNLFLDDDEDDEEAVGQLDRHELRAILGDVDDDFEAGSAVRLVGSDSSGARSGTDPRPMRRRGGSPAGTDHGRADPAAPEVVAGSVADDNDPTASGEGDVGRPSWGGDDTWRVSGPAPQWGEADEPAARRPAPVPGRWNDVDDPGEDGGADREQADHEPGDAAAAAPGPLSKGSDPADDVTERGDADDDAADQAADDAGDGDAGAADGTADDGVDAAADDAAGAAEGPDQDAPRQATAGEPDDVAGDGDEQQSAPPRRTAPDSKLTPAEIQARLRAGKSVRSVARAAGTDKEWIERWEAPIIEERARMLRDAHGRRVVRQRLGRSRHNLAESVRRNLGRRKVTVENVRWEAARRKDGRWRVTVRWKQRGRSRSASWLLDVEQDELVPASTQARELGWTGRRKRRS